MDVFIVAMAVVIGGIVAGWKVVTIKGGKVIQSDNGPYDLDTAAALVNHKKAMWGIHPQQKGNQPPKQ